jgi:hypothetical protein
MLMPHQIRAILALTATMLIATVLILSDSCPI